MENNYINLLRVVYIYKKKKFAESYAWQLNPPGAHARASV